MDPQKRKNLFAGEASLFHHSYTPIGHIGEGAYGVVTKAVVNATAGAISSAALPSVSAPLPAPVPPPAPAPGVVPATGATLPSNASASALSSSASSASTSNNSASTSSGSASGSASSVSAAAAAAAANAKCVAVKQMKNSREGVGIAQDAYREMKILHELSFHHVNLVRLAKVFLRPDFGEVDLVYEYAENDLADMIRHHRGVGGLDARMVKSILKQLLEGIKFLHENWVMHRDLKPANILVMGEGERHGTVKIADFGLARIFQSPPRKLCDDGEVVTIWYRAPELLLGAKHYSRAIDMWAIGCIFFEMMRATPLFPGEEVKNSKFQENQLKRIFTILGYPQISEWTAIIHLPLYSKIGHWQSKEFRFRLAELLPHYAIQKPDHLSAFGLLKQMLVFDPNRRISAEDALKHGYFNESPLPSANVFLDSHDKLIHYPKRKCSERRPDGSDALKMGSAAPSQHTNANNAGNAPNVSAPPAAVSGTGGIPAVTVNLNALHPHGQSHAHAHGHSQTHHNPIVNSASAVNLNVHTHTTQQPQPPPQHPPHLQTHISQQHVHPPTSVPAQTQPQQTQPMLQSVPSQSAISIQQPLAQVLPLQPQAAHLLSGTGQPVAASASSTVGPPPPPPPPPFTAVLSAGGTVSADLSAIDPRNLFADATTARLAIAAAAAAANSRSNTNASQLQSQFGTSAAPANSTVLPGLVNNPLLNPALNRTHSLAQSHTLSHSQMQSQAAALQPPIVPVALATHLSGSPPLPAHQHSHTTASMSAGTNGGTSGSLSASLHSLLMPNLLHGFSPALSLSVGGAGAGSGLPIGVSMTDGSGSMQVQQHQRLPSQLSHLQLAALGIGGGGGGGGGAELMGSGPSTGVSTSAVPVGADLNSLTGTFPHSLLLDLHQVRPSNALAGLEDSANKRQRFQ